MAELAPPLPCAMQQLAASMRCNNCKPTHLLARRAHELCGRRCEEAGAQRRDAQLAGRVQLHLAQQLREAKWADG